jgi:hypothetical protein
VRWGGRAQLESLPSHHHTLAFGQGATRARPKNESEPFALDAKASAASGAFALSAELHVTETGCHHLDAASPAAWWQHFRHSFMQHKYWKEIGLFS